MKNYLQILILFCLLSRPAFAGTHITLKGNSKTNYFGLNTESDQSGSASIAWDLGYYFQLGFTYRKDTTREAGYQPIGTGSVFVFTDKTTYMTASSVDLNIVLYQGAVFTPYISLGMVKKNYRILYVVEDDPSMNAPPSIQSGDMPPVPNGGIGLDIRMTSDFSLSLSYSVSPSVKQISPLYEPVGSLDTYSSIGIKYTL